MKRLSKKNRLKRCRPTLKKNEMCAIFKLTKIEKRFLVSKRKNKLINI